MPELPEVETVMRGMQPALEGKKLINIEARCDSLRWPIPNNFADRLKGRRVINIARRAKYILWYLDDETVMILHLGMSGRVSITAKRPSRIENHDHLIFTTEEGIKTIKQFFGKLIDWKKLDDLIPKNFKKGSKYKRTGKAGIFAGSLELVKEGNLRIKQNELFEDIYVRENK